MKLWVLFPIDVKVERESLYERLKQYIETVERILNDEDVDYETRMKAAGILAQLIGKAAKVITDSQLDEIQSGLEDLRERMKKIKEEKTVGYW